MMVPRPAEPWLPQPPDWGRYSVESQLADERSFLSLYRTALRLRRDHPALGRGTLRWLDAEGLLCFAREPGFILAANLGAASAPLPAHREILLASEPAHRRQPAARHRRVAVVLSFSSESGTTLGPCRR